ncbi:MAG: hypothetical protein ACKO1F_12305, partial [Flammeovirgaceae bacterium]
MKRFSPFLLILIFFGWQCTPSSSTRLRFAISFTKEMIDSAQDGHIVLMLANNNQSEPRNQINFGLKTQLAFGLDVDGLKPGEEIFIDESVFGFPVRSIKDIPAGDDYVQ